MIHSVLPSIYFLIDGVSGHDISIVRQSDALFCETCSRLCAVNETQEAADVYYCPSCMDSMSAVEANAYSCRCPKCFECPECFCNLVITTSMRNNVALASLHCRFCGWDSGSNLNAANRASTPDEIVYEINKHEREGQVRQEFLMIMNKFRASSQAKATEDRILAATKKLGVGLLPRAVRRTDSQMLKSHIQQEVECKIPSLAGTEVHRENPARSTENTSPGGCVSFPLDTEIQEPEKMLLDVEHRIRSQNPWAEHYRNWGISGRYISFESLIHEPVDQTKQDAHDVIALKPAAISDISNASSEKRTSCNQVTSSAHRGAYNYSKLHIMENPSFEQRIRFPYLLCSSPDMKKPQKPTMPLRRQLLCTAMKKCKKCRQILVKRRKSTSSIPPFVKNCTAMALLPRWTLFRDSMYLQPYEDGLTEVCFQIVNPSTSAVDLAFRFSPESWGLESKSFPSSLYVVTPDFKTTIGAYDEIRDMMGEDDDVSSAPKNGSDGSQGKVDDNLFTDNHEAAQAAIFDRKMNSICVKLCAVPLEVDRKPSLESLRFEVDATFLDYLNKSHQVTFCLLVVLGSANILHSICASKPST